MGHEISAEVGGYDTPKRYGISKSKDAVLSPLIASSASIKILIRGASKSGKSALYDRISGSKVLQNNGMYTKTPEIQVNSVLWKSRMNYNDGNTINSNSKSNSDDSMNTSGSEKQLVRLEIWDIVDEADYNYETGGNKHKDIETKLIEKINEASTPSNSSFSGTSGLSTGKYTVGPLDLAILNGNVYQGSNSNNALLVIFMVCPFIEESLQYVRDHYKDVPDNTSILIIFNKCDLTLSSSISSLKTGADDERTGADDERTVCITMEDVKKLCQEIIEERGIDSCHVILASMKDCYGLKALNSWIEMSFLKFRKDCLQKQLNNTSALLVDAVSNFAKYEEISYSSYKEAVVACAEIKNEIKGKCSDKFYSTTGFHSNTIDVISSEVKSEELEQNARTFGNQDASYFPANNVGVTKNVTNIVEGNDRYMDQFTPSANGQLELDAFLGESDEDEEVVKDELDTSNKEVGNDNDNGDSDIDKYDSRYFSNDNENKDEDEDEDEDEDTWTPQRSLKRIIASPQSVIAKVDKDENEEDITGTVVTGSGEYLDKNVVIEPEEKVEKDTEIESDGIFGEQVHEGSTKVEETEETEETEEMDEPGKAEEHRHVVKEIEMDKVKYVKVINTESKSQQEFEKEESESVKAEGHQQPITTAPSTPPPNYVGKDDNEIGITTVHIIASGKIPGSGGGEKRRRRKKS